MIITITCNPAIDKTVYDNNTVFDIGGKGINVSKVLKNLNVDSICTGFIGRNNKDIILNKLDELNIRHNFVEIDGDIRTNTKRILNNELYEENEKGPVPDENDINRLFSLLKEYRNEIVVISGSSNVDIYYDLIKLLKDNNNYVILDADNNLLKNSVKARPDIIKPNKDEICRLFDCEYDEEIIIDRCRELNLDLVCLSLGKDGALFIDKDNAYKVKALDVEYKSALGAGDSMVAALAYGRYNNLNIKDTIRLVMACAGSSVECEGSSAPSKKRVFDMIKKVKVE